MLFHVHYAIVTLKDSKLRYNSKYSRINLVLDITALQAIKKMQK